MIHRVLTIALVAGLAAGLFVSALQMIKVVPMIQQAEIYENGDNPGASASHDHTSHDHKSTGYDSTGHESGSVWAPEDGLERTAYTVLTNVLTGFGYALLLCAGIVMRGQPVTLKEGVIWGLGGFLTFSLFPSLGLPPELPGTFAADLESRQIWWVMTAAASAAGLSLIAFNKNYLWKVVGLLLIALPHIIGAPHPEEAGGTAPPSMAAEFAMVSMVTSALFWMVIGGTSGWLFDRHQSKAS